MPIVLSILVGVATVGGLLLPRLDQKEEIGPCTIFAAFCWGAVAGIHTIGIFTIAAFLLQSK